MSVLHQPDVNYGNIENLSTTFFGTSVPSPMLFNFALEYAIRRVQVNQDGLKLNGTHQLLAYADDVNILGGRIHNLKENAESLVAATREIGLEVSADKTKYMVKS